MLRRNLRWLVLMRRLLARSKARLREAAKPLGGAAVRRLTTGMLRTTRYFDPIKTANLFGRVTRSIAPLLREQRIGRANLTAAFPEKSPEEIEAILAGVWDNLGRVGAEFAHLDRVWDYEETHPELSRIEVSPRSLELFHQLRLDGKPALIFASHLGNWELPAVAAVAHGLNATILYRRPNSASADRIIQEMRAVQNRGRWFRPAATRRSGWRTRCSEANTSRCWSISTGPAASRSLFSAARPGPIRRWRGCCGKSSARSTERGSSACPATASAPK